MGQLTPPPTGLPPFFILSGPREIGKTTFLKQLIEQTQDLHIRVAGVISPAVVENGQKTAIDLVDLSTGSVKRLANLRQTENQGIYTERWAFSTESLEWGNQLLVASIPCDLLIVDELGPIELERGQGWQNGVLALSSNQFLTAVVVIRPELLGKAFSLWPQARLIEITQRNEAGLAQMRGNILATLQRSSSHSI